MTTHDFTALPDLASRALGGNVSAANDELFAQRENLIKAEAPFFDPNDSATRARCTTAGKPAAAATTATTTPSSGSAHAGIIHGIIVDTCVLQGQLPAVRLDRGGLDRGISLHRGDHEGGLADHRREVARAEGHTRQRLRRCRPAPVDSRAALDLSRRRRRAAARTRRGGTGSPVPRRDRGPAGRGERRPPGRLLGCVLCLSGEHHPSRPGPRTWGRAGRTRADAAPATTLPCSPSPPPAARATSRSTPATTSVTRRAGCG